jgi:hypothetical protein
MSTKGGDIMTQEIIVEKLRQNLGPLSNQAVSAVKEVLKMLHRSEGMDATLAQNEKFIGANVSVEQYEAWSDDDRMRYQTEPEQANAAWIQKRLHELQAAWLMVIDGNVVAHGALTEYPFENEFDTLCKKFGKFPFVFLNPTVLMIEEACDWHKTSEQGGFYPTALIGRDAFLNLRPVVHLDFDAHQTTIEYHAQS